MSVDGDDAHGQAAARLLLLGDSERQAADFGAELGWNAALACVERALVALAADERVATMSAGAVLLELTREVCKLLREGPDSGGGE